MNVTKFHIKETIFFQILCIPFEFLVSFANMYENSQMSCKILFSPNVISKSLNILNVKTEVQLLILY